MTTDTVSPAIAAILESATATSAEYGIDLAEVLAWRLEDAKKDESQARRLVTIRSRKLARQERIFIRTHEEHPHLPPRARGYQQAALDGRRSKLAEAIQKLGAAAHVLVGTEAVIELAGREV
jgi:hypothetical protein